MILMKAVYYAEGVCNDTSSIKVEKDFELGIKIKIA